ncbi:unnamed protein product [Lampetra fluviatilis]
MSSIPDDVKNLLEELEQFLSEALASEKSLGKKCKERREALLKTLNELKFRYPDVFAKECDQESNGQSSDVSSTSQTDLTSEPSEAAQEDAAGHEVYVQLPAIAASDLPNVIKAGFLDKKRKDHSFFVGEWQRRWCVLGSNALYYYGDRKDKQQKGAVPLAGYSLRATEATRKDRKSCCSFELSAPDKRSFQFSTSTADDARSWMSYIRQVIRDLRSSVIEEEEDEDDDGGDLYDDIDPIEQVKATPPASTVHKEVVAVDPIDEDIYELLPDDDEEPVVVVVTRTDAAKAAQAPPPVASKAELNSAAEAWDATQRYDNFYQGLWDCSADCLDELSFKRGDLVHVLSKEYDAFRWWVGEANGSVGLVPKDYLMAAYDT